jgi:hypothetical protein
MITLRDGDGRVVARATARPPRSLVWLPRGGAYEVDESGAVSEGPGEPVLAAAARPIVLPAAMLAQGFAALHASAVEIRGWAAVFAGASGAGKSTLAAALGGRGHRYLADDFVGLDPAASTPGCVTPPASPRLLEASRAHLEPKSRVWSDTTTRSRLGAIFLMERGDAGEAPSIESVKPSAAFSLVLAHAHDAAWDEPGRKRRDVTFFLRLASSVPALRLRFAHSFEDLPCLLELVEAAMGPIEAAERDATAKASTP